MSDPTAVHQWAGTRWVPAFSIDSWGLAVRRRWPEARLTVVARGAVWWQGAEIVAEVRNRRGWPPREAWVAEPREQP